MVDDEEPKIELVGWQDHEDHMWSDKRHAASYFKGKSYTLRPVYVVDIPEEFNGH